MLYNTTRDTNAAKTFADIVCLSNAPCGGLYIPKELPHLTNEDFKGMSYSEIAEKIISIFTEIPKEDIVDIVSKSIQNFTVPKLFETKKLTENLTIAELFHGPTLSFKDYPMQFLGNIIEYILKRENKKLNILTATSGDTGSAAIHAFAGKENIKIVVLHPKGRVTEFQRKQMTTCHAENVLNIAVEGTFDDCQAIVKEITNSNWGPDYNISTVNSINWGRIMMQIVYYIKIISDAKKPVNIFVPTGNFGNIFACYFLKKCGFNGINKMFISNNANDVITKAYQTGVMKISKTIHTVSPAIDISIPSNFERMLFLESNANEVTTIYRDIKNGKDIHLNQMLWQNFKNHFNVYSVSDGQTIATMKDVHEKYGYVIDPHTAVAFAHFQKERPEGSNIIISTAHPCKFEDAVVNAIGIKPKIPEVNADVCTKKEGLQYANQTGAKDKIMNFFTN